MVSCALHAAFNNSRTVSSHDEKEPNAHRQDIAKLWRYHRPVLCCGQTVTHQRLPYTASESDLDDDTTTDARAAPRAPRPRRAVVAGAGDPGPATTSLALAPTPPARPQQARRAGLRPRGRRVRDGRDH